MTQLDERPVGAPTVRRPTGRRPRTREQIIRRRRLFAIGVLAAGIFVIWLAVSLGFALTNPALGTSFSSRFAEWARENGGGSLVNWVEKEWYSHHQPPVGGKPPNGEITRVHGGATAPVTSSVSHLPAPAAIAPFASPAVPGEGQWSAAGRLVHGLPAIYETRLRPDAVHTSEVVGIAWMDTKLLKATLYSGSQIPGGGPFTHTAPVQPTAANSLVAAFNAGFLLSGSNGGYYTDGRTVAPLRQGAASFVIDKNGDVTLGQWGRDVSMSANVVSVRQNLNLLVDNGQPVPSVSNANSSAWGATLGGGLDVWRSGVGETLNGALVYVGGPALNISTLADLLVRAGAVRAMELDINTDWVNLATFAPPAGTSAASATDGVDLLPTMAGAPGRYFATWWARDFFTMSAR
ncbi:MAG TPA: phosphodiester glycosidase family protein [Acidimicrobiales bacterium]